MNKKSFMKKHSLKSLDKKRHVFNVFENFEHLFKLA